MINLTDDKLPQYASVRMNFSLLNPLFLTVNDDGETGNYLKECRSSRLPRPLLWDRPVTALRFELLRGNGKTWLWFSWATEMHWKSNKFVMKNTAIMNYGEMWFFFSSMNYLRSEFLGSFLNSSGNFKLIFRTYFIIFILIHNNSIRGTMNECNSNCLSIKI